MDLRKIETDSKKRNVFNNRGQIFLLGMMIALFVLIFALISAPVLKFFIDDSRTQMDCGNASISTGTKMTCLVTDLTLPYYIGAIVLACAAYLFIRRSQEV